MAKKQYLAYAAMAAAMTTVGSTIVASKLMVQMPIFLAMVVRFAVASLLLAGLLMLLQKPWPRLSARGWRLLLVQALIGSVGYSALLLLGLELTSASDASVVTGALPAMAAVLALVVLKEKLTPSRWLAVALATAAMVLLNSGSAAGTASAGPNHLLGNALVLGAVACEAVFLLVNKRLDEPIDPLWTAALMSTLSFALCLPVAVVQTLVGHPAAVPHAALLAAVYYAVVPTTLGFWLWYAGSSRVSGSQAGLFTTFLPLSGLALAALALGEPVEPRHWLGVGLAVLSILIGLAPGRCVAQAAH